MMCTSFDSNLKPCMKHHQHRRRSCWAKKREAHVLCFNLHTSSVAVLRLPWSVQEICAHCDCECLPCSICRQRGSNVYVARRRISDNCVIHETLASEAVSGVELHVRQTSAFDRTPTYGQLPAPRAHPCVFHESRIPGDRRPTTAPIWCFRHHDP